MATLPPGPFYRTRQERREERRILAECGEQRRAIIRRGGRGRSFRTMSKECMLGHGHFLRCPKMDCKCVCHRMDEENIESIHAK